MKVWMYMWQHRAYNWLCWWFPPLLSKFRADISSENSTVNYPLRMTLKASRRLLIFTLYTKCSTPCFGDVLQGRGWLHYWPQFEFSHALSIGILKIINLDLRDDARVRQCPHFKWKFEFLLALSICIIQIVVPILGMMCRGGGIRTFDQNSSFHMCYRLTS